MGEGEGGGDLWDFFIPSGGIKWDFMAILYSSWDFELCFS